MKNTAFENNNFDTYSIVASAGDENEVEVIDNDEAAEESTPDEDTSNIDFQDLLSQMKELMSDLDDDDDSEIDMDADDYHNQAVDYARHSKYGMAASLCQEGLEKFPLNIDLLADTIKYSADAGDMERAAEYYTILNEKVPYKCWNWRAFTFSFDYLLQRDPIANEDDCRILIMTYRNCLPYEEKADMAESELEDALGNMEASMNVLKNALHTHTNARQCALRLADMQMDRGLYEDVIKTANYGIAASAEPQPSINVPYLYFIRTLAKDYILHRKECTGEKISEKEVDALREDYELLLSEFPRLKHYESTIKTRVKMLKFVKASKS